MGNHGRIVFLQQTGRQGGTMITATKNPPLGHWVEHPELAGTRAQWRNRVNDFPLPNEAPVDFDMTQTIDDFAKLVTRVYDWGRNGVIDPKTEARLIDETSHPTNRDGGNFPPLFVYPYATKTREVVSIEPLLNAARGAHAGVTAADIAKVMRTFDTDNNGTLDYNRGEVAAFNAKFAPVVVGARTLTYENNPIDPWESKMEEAPLPPLKPTVQS